MRPALPAAVHRDTWFKVGNDQPDRVHTSVGSRPGDCYADVVFGLLWAKLLRAYEADLTRFGVLERIPIEFPCLQPVRIPQTKAIVLCSGPIGWMF